jgi:hypothetical protein
MGWALALLTASTGCVNPQLANRVTGDLYPITPGTQPYLMVRVINDTTATVDVPIVYNDGVADREYIISGLTPEASETGILLEWPVLEVAVGSLTDPYGSGIIATLPDGSVAAVPFGHDALQAGVNYDRGDTIIFYITPDARSEAFITISIGYIDADWQPDTFTRADPFEATRLILLLNGF